MEEKRSWWQRVRKPLAVFVVFVGVILVIALFVVIVQAYIFNVDVPGFQGARMEGARLMQADLSGANLDRANLSVFYDPKNKKLINTDLSGANLKNAIGVTVKQLDTQARSFKGATMPDGSIHP